MEGSKKPRPATLIAVQVIFVNERRGPQRDGKIANENRYCPGQTLGCSREINRCRSCVPTTVLRERAQFLRKK